MSRSAGSTARVHPAWTMPTRVRCPATTRASLPRYHADCLALTAASLSLGGTVTDRPPGTPLALSHLGHVAEEACPYERRPRLGAIICLFISVTSFRTRLKSGRT